MNRSLISPDRISPDEVLDAHVRALAGRYRDRLAEAYDDPTAAYDFFRETVARRGQTDAAAMMAKDPAAFGSLRENGAGAAGEAGLLGSRAYHVQEARKRPETAAAVLDQAFTDAIAEVSGEAAVPRVRATWDALNQAYGPERAAAVAVRRGREFLGADFPAERVAEIARLAAARDILREGLGLVPAPAKERAIPLPRSLADEREMPEKLPEHLQERLVSGAYEMRKRLALAYVDTLAAEANIHAMVNERGAGAVVLAERDPRIVGTLRADRPGGAAESVDLARAALAYSRIAYDYHGARFPDHAAELEARDALLAARRAARDPERAMEGVQEAIQLRGPELAQHLDRAREDTGPARGGPAGPVPPGPELPGGESRPGGGTPPAVDALDPAVDEVVRAIVGVEGLLDQVEATKSLRKERTSAEEQVALLDADVAKVAAAKRDVRAVAADAYEKPDAAIKKWDDLVAAQRGNLERATEMVRARPELLGRLKTEPFDRAVDGPLLGVFGPLLQVAGFGSTKAAKEDVEKRLLETAATYTEAQRSATTPFQWESPEGKTVRGRENVREVAEALIEDRTVKIDAAEGRIREVGGVRNAEERAMRAFEGLRPEQKNQAAARVGAATGRSRPAVATRLSGKLALAMRAGTVARSLGEGPAGL